MNKMEIFGRWILSGVVVGSLYAIGEIAWKSHKAKRQEWKLATDAEKAANPGSKD